MPVVLLSVLIMAMEIITASFRIAYLPYSIIVYINGAVYFGSVIVMLIYYIRVSVSVLKFLQKLQSKSTKQGILLKVRNSFT